MILYKYLTLEGLEACIQNRTLKFSAPHTFNDPFDFSASPHGLCSHPHWEKTMSNPDRLFMYRRQLGVLCLTRNPLNSLMWSHYGDKHTGAVIGIETEYCGLECSEDNLIPALSGSVQYHSRRPDVSSDILPSVEFLSATNRQLLERLFLIKAAHWAYEEEVRVVRKLKNISNYELIPFNPVHGIAEIYVGAAFFSQQPSEYEPIKRKFVKIFENLPAKKFVCGLHQTTWELETSPWLD